ncbi:hypothetical protein ILYODFUR_038954 [Ilyodon furcidens]|uniref:Uncharacterized protein n=1 Tax=Ilyodon furcidens TaxID=33524 RepID=A0ABV0UMM3_9TELE
MIETFVLLLQIRRDYGEIDIEVVLTCCQSKPSLQVMSCLLPIKRENECKNNYFHALENSAVFPGDFISMNRLIFQFLLFYITFQIRKANLSSNNKTGCPFSWLFILF